MTSLNAGQHVMPEGRDVVREGASRAGRLAARVRVLLGLRRTFTVDGVRYTERSTEPLRRSLSRKGAGLKEYEAAFGDGYKLRLHCTPARVYADLSGPVLLPRYRLVEDLLSPGMRVLDVSCGTGYGAAWLLERVGPSGAVVALDRDRESVKYAQHRYAAANAAFEQGGVETLYGELAGGFEAVLAMRGLDSQSGLEATLRELWRVVSPGGWMLIAEPIGGRGHGEDSLERLLARVTAETAAKIEPPGAADGSGAEAEDDDEDERARGAEPARGVAAEARITRLEEAGPGALWLVMKAVA